MNKSNVYTPIVSLLFAMLIEMASGITCYADEYVSHVQGIVGATLWDEDDLTFTEVNDEDPSAVAESDLSTMPTIGAAWWGTFHGERLAKGIEAGLLVSWMSDDASVAGSSGSGKAAVRIDTSLVLLDLFFGVHLNFRLGQNAHAYVAAGPLLMIGWADDEREEEIRSTGRTIRISESDNDVGAGVYGRAGLEFGINENDSMGIGVRGLNTELEFSEPTGEVDLKGVQVAVTYTRAL